jgi:hypothetical protein
MQTGKSHRATPRTGTLLMTEIDIGISGVGDRAQRHLSTTAFKLG